MKRVYNNYFLVGLFTLIIGGVSILLLFKMSGNNKGADSYYSYFDNVTGLGYGNPVYYEGYRVGQIEKITPETDSGKLLFKTEYTLIQGWEIPSDSFTKIESSGLLSDMSLSIKAGSATDFIAPQSEIKSIKGNDIMATVSKLANDFGTLNQEKIMPLLDLVYERTDVLTKSLETQIPKILTSIDVLIADMNKLVIDANKMLSTGNLKGVENIIDNIEDLSKQISGAGNWVEGSIDKVNTLLDTGKDLVNNSDSKVSTLLDITIKMMDSFSTKAETIGSEIESASMNINEATESIRKKPSSLIFSDKSKVADEDL